MDRKNIIFIVMDTARAGNFSFYGYDRETAPFLNKLVDESVLYKNAVSQHIWTMPSHACIFKNEYGKDHRATSDDFRLEENPLINKLNEEGYYTSAISNNRWITEDFGWDEGFDNFKFLYDDFPFENDDELWNKFSENDDKGWTESLKFGKYIDYTIECMKKGNLKQIFNGIYYLLNQKLHIGDSGAKSTNEIFRSNFDPEKANFFFMNYIEPHGPYRPKIGYRREFLSDDVDKEDLFKNEHSLAHQFLNGNVDSSERQMEIMRSLYDAEIKYLDSRLKELYNFLKEEGELEDTFLIIASDHGEYFGEHNLYRHNGGIYPEITNVPLLVRYPDGRQKKVEEPVEIKDLHSFVDQISQGEKPSLKCSDYAFSEYYRGITSQLEDRLEVDRPEVLEYQVTAQDKSHFLKIRQSDEEFWDLEKWKQVDEETEKRKEMRERIKEKFSDVIDNPESFVTQENKEVEEEVKSQLEKLGYMN